MKTILTIFLATLLSCPLNGQPQQDRTARIDSLVSLLRVAGREWNDYARPLIAIGEPAIPALVHAVRDTTLKPFNRRIIAITLNSIHSEQWVVPATQILFDEDEDPVLRNQVTAGLRGFDLTVYKTRLWKRFQELEHVYRKMNIARLLLAADTALAYQANHFMYQNSEGHVKKDAMKNLIQIRPWEATTWYMDGLQSDDWMTATLARDSLITTPYFKAGDLVVLFHAQNTQEKVRWHIVSVFGQRKEPESLNLLLDAMRDTSWLVHTEATVGLSRMSPDIVLPELKKLKHDTASFVRQNTRWVIRNINKEAIRESQQ